MRRKPIRVSGTPANRAGTRVRPGHREQQLVIFAAVERLVERSPGEARRSLDFRPQAGGECQAAQIERKAVAQVHGGGGAQPLAQKPSQRQARLGAGVPFPGGAA